MGMADSSRRIRVGDIELAYRITGRGKPVILIHNDRGDTAGHITAPAIKLSPAFVAFLASLGDTKRHGVTPLDTPKRYSLDPE